MWSEVYIGFAGFKAFEGRPVTKDGSVVLGVGMGPADRRAY